GNVTRQEWYPTSCCPSNIARLFGSLQQYIYTTKTGGDGGAGESGGEEFHLWVHQYIGNELELDLPGGCHFHLQLESGFPWDGHVGGQIHVDEPTEFTIHLRVPTWTENPSISVNGSAAGVVPTPGSYALVDREWRDGDSFSLELPMPVRLLRAPRRVKENRGKVAFQRGPAIYCLEGVDNPRIDVFGGHIPAGANPSASWEIGLLGGVVAIRGPWEGDDGSVGEFTAIPYHAWANRGASEMRVWIPYAGGGQVADAFASTGDGGLVEPGNW
ncbi:MAG: hypothetical protein ACTSU5_15075, partial [Promethearchaeota archaeon]